MEEGAIKKSMLTEMIAMKCAVASARLAGTYTPQLSAFSDGAKSEFNRYTSQSKQEKIAAITNDIEEKLKDHLEVIQKAKAAHSAQASDS